MPVPTDITAGTLTITNGSTAVTGVGTAWLASDLRQGDIILWIEGGDGFQTPILADVPASNTAITLVEPWEGPTLSGARYRIRYQWDSSRVSAQSRQLIELLDNGNVLALTGLTGPGVPVFDGPHSMVIKPESDFVNGVAYDVQVDLLADRAAYDGQTAGFAVLVSDVGDGRSAIYSKASNSSGDWTDAAYVTGETGGSGPYTEITIGPVTTLPSGTPANVDVVTVDSDTIRLDFSIPAGINGTGTVTSIVAGENISVDNSDPENPVISSTGGVTFDQLNGFYGSLALEQAEDRTSGPVSAGPDGNGLFDGFNTLTYVDVAGATNLNTATSGQLRPSTGTLTTVGNTTTPAAGGVNFSGVTLADRTYSLTNSRIVTEIKLYSSSAVATTLKIVRRNSATNYDVVYSQSFSHPGGGWATMTLSSPYSVAASGTYHVALYYAASQTIETFSASAARTSFGSGNATGSGLTVTETTGSCFATNATLSTGIGALSVSSAGFVVSEVPDWFNVLAFVTLNSAVVGTDLVFSVSRDGGANWQTVTMTQRYTRIGGSVVIGSGVVNFTSASGATLKWRIQTFNSKTPYIFAVGISSGTN